MKSNCNGLHNPNDVIISGISGVFSKSKNVEPFKKILVDETSPVESIELETNQGSIKNTDQFDHSFFRLTQEQADSASKSTRILLEKTFEAVLDSGHNPAQLRGKNITLVCCVSEQTEETCTKNSKQALTNNNQITIANAISSYLDLRGPSLPLHTASISSTYGLDLAVRYVREDKCDGAFVCAANFCSESQNNGFDSSTSAKAKSSPSDTEGNGYVKSEAAVVIFIQKRNLARRVYATIGPVESNIGPDKTTAALCSVIKMIISFETGFIPANINNSPNTKISELLDGQTEVINEPTSLESKYFAINFLEIDGTNGQILLKPHNRTKNLHDYETIRIPKLVTVSGRTEKAVEYILGEVEKNIEDVEYIRLLHGIFSEDISGHLHRGYIISNTNKKITKSKNSFSGEKRPIWFFFPGLGSQWPTMGRSLMEIPIFAKSIQNSHQVLLSKGLDLIKIITDDDPKMFENVLHTFVGLTAIQIGLADVLTALGVEPDGIIGHSHGELACAYADGCLTAEQTVLMAYYRGIVFKKAKLIHCVTGVIGMGYEDLSKVIPPQIDIACHNNLGCCTFGGPAEIVKKFIKEQQEKNVFACEVETSNIAFHTRYVSSLGAEFMSHFKTIIPEAKLRSKKWISTSALETDWNSNPVKYSSAEYHANNLLVPVYFEQSCRHIPNNAVIIEIAPHGMMNSVLNRMFPDTVDNIRLTKKDEENQVEYLFNALGQIYEASCALKLDQLYPPVEFPVSRSTPMISPLILWPREEKLVVTNDSIDSSNIGKLDDNGPLTTHNETKNSNNSEITRIPKLVTVSGTTEKEIDNILDDVEKNIEDVEYTRLMHEIFGKDISGHSYRGYIISKTKDEITKSKKLFSGEKPPLWFFYSGLESQWPTMAKSLMPIPIFAKSIQNCHQILLSKGLDLIKIITEDDPKIFENILNTFVGITAIQIALTDTLTAIGLEPDGIIGQSHGDLACGYADGCLSAEQALLLSYYTGLLSSQTEFVPCSMGATVGVPYDDLVKLMPPEIEIGCHNGPGSYTICGPTEILKNFINELKEDDKFAFEINASNAAYHTRYMADLVPKLLAQFKSIIPNPKQRSEKWICTSALEKDWNTDWVQFPSAKHLAENLMQTVYFEEAYAHIPSNAVIVEIAPHALLTPVLKMLFHDSTEKISLTSRDHGNNAEYFLNAIGQLFEMGYTMKLDLLYPPVDIPIGKSTPIVSQLVKRQPEETQAMNGNGIDKKDTAT